MQLDKITAEIRLRTPFEAIDLGVAMARAAGRRMWAPWFAVTLPLFLLCNLAAYQLGSMWLGVLFLWLLKPMCDRVPLFVLSRGLFGEEVGVLDTLKALPRLWWGAFPLALLLERLDMARSLDQPVAQLEGLGPIARGKRQRLLQRNARGPGVVLTFTCLGIELALFFSAWMLVLMFVPFDYLPESYRALWATFMTHVTPLHQFIINAVWYLAVSVMEPLYVGAGFALYLNRRSELEAWDLEIALRRLAERVSAGAKAAVLLAVLLLVPTCLLAPCAAHADTSVPAPEAATAPADAASSAAPADTTFISAEVMRWPRPGTLPADAERRFSDSASKAYQDPDLSPHEQQGRWEYKGDAPDKSDKPKPLPAWLQKLLELFGSLGDHAGTGISFIPWLIGLALLALAVRYRKSILALFQSLGAGPRATVFDTGMRMLADAEKLPEDVVRAAREAWEKGDARAALSLLYRGGVERMQQISGRELPQGATETDCLREAARLPDAPAATLRQVVRAWQYAAYAHRLPDAAAFSVLLDAWQADLGVKA
jgi:hypothetical protein